MLVFERYQTESLLDEELIDVKKFTLDLFKISDEFHTNGLISKHRCLDLRQLVNLSMIFNEIGLVNEANPMYNEIAEKFTESYTYKSFRTEYWGNRLKNILGIK